MDLAWTWLASIAQGQGNDPLPGSEVGADKAVVGGELPRFVDAVHSPGEALWFVGLIEAFENMGHRVLKSPELAMVVVVAEDTGSDRNDDPCDAGDECEGNEEEGSDRCHEQEEPDIYKDGADGVALDDERAAENVDPVADLVLGEPVEDSRWQHRVRGLWAADHPAGMESSVRNQNLGHGSETDRGRQDLRSCRCIGCTQIGSKAKL
ncbi:uncharacterized protein BJ171DRAFT_517238 [Polychytrium aggregatum]|uniref:uncharacterized protein n=1 Tax=Polychytrium aggregatum TaxID=110093 RepID=UPI0022FEE9BE|nr:uncharacterized protein BJ171DRAFT_517238 [Polychytrium aggregatum]KAI9199875.1 hypothetical protein BJ171DRAFT_517238 [Polychytrium aggregatum]